MHSFTNNIHIGDCRVLMRQMIAAGVKVQCIVTSPPYFGLRDYGVAGQFGLERTWIRHVARMRSVFRLARELLSKDGVLWLNYGDSYHSPRANGGVGVNSTINGRCGQEEFRKASRNMKSRVQTPDTDGPNRRAQTQFKPKDLMGMPWRIAFALQADGWYLRSDIIWQKPNPMPESVCDRPTKSHEYVFLMAKSEQYYYDLQAISEPASKDSHARAARGRSDNHKFSDSSQTIAKGSPVAGRAPGVNPKCAKRVSGWATGPGSHSTIEHARPKQDAGAQIRGGDRMTGFNERYKNKQNDSFSAAIVDTVMVRNARTVWQISTEAFPGAHFATFPKDLVRRCILAGSRPGDIIFDPFMGSGTVAEVAVSLGRQYIGCELNPVYAAMFKTHRSQQQGMAI